MYDVIESFLSSIIPIIVHYHFHLIGILGKIDIPIYTFIICILFTECADLYYKKQSKIDIVYFVGGYNDRENYLAISKNKYGTFIIQIVMNDIKHCNNLKIKLIIEAPSFCTLSYNGKNASKIVRGYRNGIIINLNKLECNNGYIDIRLPLIIRQTDRIRYPRNEQFIHCKLKDNSYIREHLRLNKLSEKNTLNIKIK